MKKLMIRSLVIGCAVSLAAGAVPAVVFAHNGEEHDAVSSTPDTTSTNSNRAEHITAHQESNDDSTKNTSKTTELRQEGSSRRLEQAKLKVCKARERNISTIMTRSITRAQNQIKLFDAVTGRVQDFYNKKGNVLASYDQLVAAVIAAKTQADSNVRLLEADSFSCDAADPKGSAADFKADLQTLNQSLKDYRTAVKNLISGVKSVQGDE